MNNRDHHQKRDDNHLKIENSQTNKENTNVTALDDARRVKVMSPECLLLNVF